MLTSLKLFGLSTVLACGLCANDAQACGGGRCGGCAPRCAAPSCAAPAAMPMDTPAPPAEHPHNAAAGRQRYQSSFQTMPQPMVVRPMQRWSDQFRADHKILGR